MMRAREREARLTALLDKMAKSNARLLDLVKQGMDREDRLYSWLEDLSAARYKPDD